MGKSFEYMVDLTNFAYILVVSPQETTQNKDFFMHVSLHGCRSLTFTVNIGNCLICKMMHNLAGLKTLSC